jgi:hypothetical protein
VAVVNFKTPYSHGDSMTEREIMQQALHHLVDLADDLRRIPSDIAQTIAALEAELAKPEQEFKYTEYGLRGDENGKLSIGEIPRKPWVGLTDDEINDFDKKLRDNGDYCSLHFAWGISAKLKELNT